MNSVTRYVSALALTLLVGASAAQAQASRTWVSGVGDDANPCSRTAPCKTFAGAISKTAAKGQINVLDPGAYGAVTITKSITIEADEFAGVLASGTNAIIINAAATDVVVLRGLTIDGFGAGLNGIRVLQARQVHVENSTISNFVNRGIEVANASNAIQLFVRNTIIRSNSGASTPAGNSGAILLRPSGTGSVSALLEHVTLDQNTFGLRVEGNARATVNDSTVSGNTTIGVHAISAGPGAASIILERVTVSNNNTAVLAESSGLASVRISNTMITSNSLGLSALTGGQIISSGGNKVVGNGTDGTVTSTVPAI